MLLKAYKTKFLSELSFLNDATEAESFFYIILEKIHHLKRIDLALDVALEVSENDLEKWNKIVSELKTHKPLQYILGETEFFGLRFFVNENTLIPRPETEELVQIIINDFEIANTLTRKVQLLDIGTGSGCIAISLAKNINTAEVFAIDVSEKALEIANINAENNTVKVNFIQSDILKISNLKELVSQNSKIETTFDIIVSNPPYVRNLEKHEIKANVLEFEPHLALFVEDDDALLFYRKIGALAYKNLSENGKLYFEINQYLGLETQQLLVDLGFKNVKLIQDIYGNNRIISAVK